MHSYRWLAVAVANDMTGQSKVGLRVVLLHPQPLSEVPESLHLGFASRSLEGAHVRSAAPAQVPVLRLRSYGGADANLTISSDLQPTHQSTLDTAGPNTPRTRWTPTSQWLCVLQELGRRLLQL